MHNFRITYVKIVVSLFIEKNNSKANIVMKKEEKIVHIITSVMNYYDVDKDILNSKTRKAEIVQIRHIILYMIRYELGLTFREISDILNKESSTIIRNFQTISDRIIRDKILQLEIQDIKKEIRKKIQKNA